MITSMTKRSIFASAVVAVLFLSACGSSAQPSPTAAPAVAAPAEEPTAAPEAPAAEEPTAVPEAPAAEEPTAAPEAPAADSLFSRLTSAQKATSFTSRTTMQITGDILDMPNTNAPVTVMDMEQTYSGANSRVVIRNRSSADEEPTEVEMRVIDGKTYMKNMMGDAEQWIVLPSDQAQPGAGATDAQQAIDSLTTNPEESSGFRKSGTESIDGLTCDVYSTAESGAVTMSMMSAYNEQFEKIDKAEMRILMCPDGQMHQMKMEIIGTSKKTPGTPASIVLETRIYDFDKNVAIEVPQNVMEIPAP
jgi:PBP1b-binding outer membrane lipoprotein LpoB